VPFAPSWPPVVRDGGASTHDITLWPHDRDRLERLARSLYPEFPARWNLSHVVRVALSRAAHELEVSEKAARLSE